MDAAQQAQAYVDAAALQAVEGMPQLQMDAAAIAAAAQQLEAIQAALQQAGGSLANDQAAVAALEHLQNTKPEEYYAQLAVMGAAAAHAAENAAAGAAGGDNVQQLALAQLQQAEMDGMEQGQGSGDKPLTSRFRGVCWNKKNRRWQAAINSGGKYIYLGSFVQEEEAARAFDRAAIRLRGNRAKLNYGIAEYLDEQGNLIDDPRLSAHLQNVLGKDGGKSGKGTSTDGHDAGLALAAGGTGSLLYQPNLAQHILATGIKSDYYPYNGARKHTYGVLEVPDGCSLVAHIPGDEEAFAVLYTGTTIAPGGAGAAVWDGSGAIDLGVFDTDKDARQAAGATLKLCMFHRHTLMTTIAAATNSAAANVDAAAAAAQVGAAAASQYGLLLGGADGTGLGAGADANDAAAMAAAAAAAAASAAAGTGDSQALAQLGLASLGPNLAGSTDAQNQYKDLFAWIAAYTQQGKAALKPEEQQALEGGATSAAPAAAAPAEAGVQQSSEAELAAGAEVMAVLMAQAQGLKTVREGDVAAAAGGMAAGGYGGGAEGEGSGGGADEHAAKRARTDDGMAQLKQLSGHKLQELQDVMRSLFEQQQQQRPAA